MPRHYDATLTINEGNHELSPGDVLKGFLLFETRQECCAKGLMVKISGIAELDTPARICRRRTSKLSVYNVKPFKQPVRQLREGSSIQRFETTLPADLPPTTSVPGLKLVYRVTATTKSVCFGRSVLDEKVITVQPLLNLCRSPIRLAYGQCVNHVDWVHQGADFIFAELKLSSCSFATGEKMNVQVAVKNESQQVHITGALCNIERVITHGRGGKKTSHTRVAIHGGHVADDLGPGDGCQKTVNFPLKDQPPTGLLSRTDVSIDYRLKLAVIPADNGHRFPTLTMEVPIIIGTSPASRDADGSRDIASSESGPFAMRVENPSSQGASASTSNFSSFGRAEVSVSSEFARVTRKSRDPSLTNLKCPDSRGQEGVTPTGGACAAESADFRQQAQFESDRQGLEPKRAKRSLCDE